MHRLPPQLNRFSASVSKPAFLRLQAECARRYSSQAQYAPYGAVLTELIMLHLPEVAGEGDPDVQPVVQTTASPLLLEAAAAAKPGVKKGRAVRSHLAATG
jgi:hypothetical protein